MPGIPQLPPIELIRAEAERRKAERRERAALIIMVGILRKGYPPLSNTNGPEQLAQEAVRYADALLAELDK